MKSITDIAKECGLHYDTVFRTAKQEGIINCRELTEEQADEIQQKLHNRGYFQFLTLESKMNKL